MKGPMRNRRADAVDSHTKEECHSIISGFGEFPMTNTDRKLREKKGYPKPKF